MRPFASNHSLVVPLLLVAFTLTQRAAAQTAETTSRSLRALCDALRDDDNPDARCRVVRRAAQGGIQVALLRRFNERLDELDLAIRDRETWRVIRFGPTVYNYQYMVGSLMVKALDVHQLIPGGEPEIDLTVRRWQAMPSGTPDASCAWARGQREVHRYVCTNDDGWRCMHAQVEAGRTVTTKLEPTCPPPSESAAPEWSVDLRFTRAGLEVSARSGTISEPMASWTGTHPYEVVFGGDRRARLPEPPDGI